MNKKTFPIRLLTARELANIIHKMHDVWQQQHHDLSTQYETTSVVASEAIKGIVTSPSEYPKARQLLGEGANESGCLSLSYEVNIGTSTMMNTSRMNMHETDHSESTPRCGPLRMMCGSRHGSAPPSKSCLVHKQKCTHKTVLVDQHHHVAQRVPTRRQHGLGTPGSTPCIVRGGYRSRPSWKQARRRAWRSSPWEHSFADTIGSRPQSTNNIWDAVASKFTAPSESRRAVNQENVQRAWVAQRSARWALSVPVTAAKGPTRLLRSSKDGRSWAWTSSRRKRLKHPNLKRRFVLVSFLTPNVLASVLLPVCRKMARNSWSWTKEESASNHHVWNCMSSANQRVGFWCQHIWFGSWNPSWFCQTTGLTQICGFWTRVSSFDFYLWWSFWSPLCCLQTCTTVLHIENSVRLRWRSPDLIIDQHFGQLSF